METKNKTKTNENFASPLLGLDMFKVRFEMQYDKSKPEMGTCIGVILTVALILITVVFAGQKFDVVA